MAGSNGMAVGFPKSTVCSLREQVARTTLRNVRLQGHMYVELREDKKKSIFFCTLCLAPCYSDSVLFDHLKGSLHRQRYAAAQATLLKANPWPFNDGVFFFHDSSCQDGCSLLSNGNHGNLLQNQSFNETSLAIVKNEESLHLTSLSTDEFNSERDLTSVGVDADSGYSVIVNGDSYDLLIPGVLHKDIIVDLGVRLVGVGKVAARYYEKDGVAKEINRIWCEWLGKDYSGGDDAVMLPEHDFGIITFAYDYDLGRKGLFDDVRYLLPSSSRQEMEDNSDAKKIKRKSFSDPEDISESLSSQYDSSGEDSLSSNSSMIRIPADGYDDDVLLSKVILSKSTRRELRRHRRVATERMCDICQHKILPGKDVATLLNMKTGRIVCSSRNVNGAFHVFHISCLIHWILLCDCEVYSRQLVGSKEKRRCRRKTDTKRKGIEKKMEMETPRKQIYSVFCPECQGTGIDILGDDLEKPTVPLSEMFKYKIKASDARRSWMKNPEMLQNCSTGFDFPPTSEEKAQGKASPLKLLRFYRTVG